MADTAQVLIQIRGDVGDINAKLADLRGNIGKVAAEAGLLGKGLGSAFGSLKTIIGGLAAGFSVKMFADMIRETAGQIDAIEEMAQKAGVAAGELQGLGAVAQLSGTSMEALTKGFKGLSTTLVEAQQGSTEAAQALATLGVQARDAESSHSQLMERFLQAAGAVSQMEDGYVKTAFATKLFGRAGMEMIPVLNQGRAAIEQMIQRARDWGVVLEEDAIAKIAAFNDHLDEFSLRMQGAKNLIMSGMVDGLNQLADAYDRVIAQGSFWEDLGETLGVLSRETAEFLIGMKALFELLATGFAGLWQVIKGDKTLADLRAELDAIDKKWLEVRREVFERPPPKDPEARRTPATPPKASDLDKIQNTIDKLRIEEAQLGKTAKEQAVYNALREAGFKLDEKTGEFRGDREKIRVITELTESIYEQKKALEQLAQVNKRAEQIMQSNRTEAENWADQLEDLRDLVNSGKITWEAYGLAVAKVNAEMAKTDFAGELAALQRQRTEIAALEARGETFGVEIAGKKREALAAELTLRQRLLDLMPRITAEQQAAWNSEAEAMDRVRAQILEQENVIRRYGDLWSGARQGIKSYFDDAAAGADQMKKAVENAFKGMEDALFEFVRNGKLSFSSLVDSILNDLLRLAIRQSIMAPLSAGLGGLMGGLLPTFNYHTGGVVGAEGGARFVVGVNPAALPRYHGGVGPGEQLAVLQKGEGVFTAGQMKALGQAMGGSGVTVNIIDRTGSDITTQSRETQQGQEIDVIIDQAVAKKLGQFGSSSNRMLKQTYGARERLVSR